MAQSVNKTILIGRVGADPIIRTMPDGFKAASLSIATTDSWKDKTTGERKERTEWHRVSILNQGMIKVCESYIKKGHMLYVEGQSCTRRYTDNQNVERYVTEIVLRPYQGTLIMLTSNGNGAPPPINSEDDYGYESSMSPEQIDEIPF